MKTIDIGRLGEKYAASFLKKEGYKLVGTNVHCSHNEIDLIVKDKKFIVFVEVKTRTTDEDLFSPYGSPAMAVDRNKQRRTITAARIFLKDNDYPSLQPRFDVIEVYINRDSRKILDINHIINAFGA